MVVRRYDILPHTADGKFRAYGRSLEEAFSNAALATASLMWDWSKIEPRFGISVEIRARDREQLLVKFLGEIIYLLEARRFQLGRVEDLKIESDVPTLALTPDPDSRLRLTARFLGDSLSDRSEIYGAVKAATYNEMKIERCDCGADPGGGPDGAPEGYVVQVVVDM